MPPDLLSAEERRVMDKISGAHEAILAMGLSANVEEIAPAVHVLQSFVIQHMLHRLSPAEFSDWYAPKEKS